MLQKMLQMAEHARQQAYAPYSQFHVGVCLRSTSGQFHIGCNVENASYGLTQCAEKNAIGNMVVIGEQRIAEVVIVGPEHVLCTPCGACRQLLREFGDDDLPIHVRDEKGYLQTFTLGQLLPFSFSSHLLGER